MIYALREFGFRVEDSKPEGDVALKAWLQEGGGGGERVVQVHV